MASESPTEAHQTSKDVGMTDLTRLVSERKQVDLQILKLEQALSALTIDANLTSAIRPERTISDDAQDSIAAVEVMLEALQQRRLDLTNEIEAARHRRHDLATAMQQEKEEKLLNQSEASMKRHLAQSKKVADHTLKKITKKNDEHDRRVGAIYVSRQIQTNRALTSLQKSILDREKADAEKQRKKEEERAFRYAEYCRRERERALRLEQLESLRMEHHTSLVGRKSRANSPVQRDNGGSARPLPLHVEQSKGGRSSPQHYLQSETNNISNVSMAGAGHSAARDLGNSRTPSPPLRSISPSLLAPPGRIRVGSLKELEAKTAAGRARHQKMTERVVARLGKAHAELEGKRAVHSEQQYREAMRVMKEKEAERAAAQERIDELRREQETQIELSRIEREQRTSEAIRRSKLRNAEFRWSRRAQRLIESVCSEIVATTPPHQ